MCSKSPFHLRRISQLLIASIIVVACVCDYVHAYAEKTDTFAHIDRILLDKNSSHKQIRKGYNELYQHVLPLPEATHHHISFVTPKIGPGAASSFSICNPSIYKISSGYVAIVRLVNYGYRYTGGGAIYFLDPAFLCYINQNAIVFLNKDFSIRKVKILDASLATRPISAIKGIYDIRIIKTFFNGKNISILACSHEHNQNGLAQMVYGYIEEKGDDFVLTQCVPLEGPDPSRHEKNWMAFESKGKLSAFYLYDPLTTYSIDRKTGKCALLHAEQVPCNYSKFSGSAPPIDFAGGKLLITHEKVFLSKPRWFYTHRFVWISKSGKIRKISYPFIFQHKGIEFCCGMTKSHQKNRIVIGYSVEDKEAHIATVSSRVIRKMLHTPPLQNG